MEFSDDLANALASSDRAAELALSHFEAGVEATLKSDGSPVTEADRAVERLLRKDLGAAAPDDAFHGEEFGAVGTSDRVWILDPIDGTSSFANENPNWRVQVALQVRGKIDVAVVTAPAIGLQWWASRGNGSFESSWPRTGDPTRLTVSTTSKVKEARLGALNKKCRARLPQEARLSGPHALGWCSGMIDLLRGKADCYFSECCQLWDHAPWILLVEEAGGRFTNRSGGTGGEQRGGLYSNAALHEQLLTAIGYPIPG